MILVLVFVEMRTAFNFFLVKAYKLDDTEIVVIPNSKNSKVESLLCCLRNKVYVAYSKFQCHSCLVGAGISTCSLWAVQLPIVQSTVYMMLLSSLLDTWNLLGFFSSMVIVL